MDKLRALEYFSHAVQAGTLAGAAAHFDVSTSAVTQLVASLERSLGTTLLRRSNRGLALTPDGERYYAHAQAMLDELRAVETGLGAGGTRLRGTLTIGMRGTIASACVIPQLSRFTELHPDLELVLKPVEQVKDFDMRAVDVAVMTGWPPDGEFVVRWLAQTRNVVCASANYWERRGKPTTPEDLQRHECLVMRSSGGMLLDRWIFAKKDDERAIDVQPRILSDQVNWIVDAAAAGCGVARIGDIVLIEHLRSGALVPVLTDWEALEAPSHFALYRPAQRRSRRVRAFIEFLVELFAGFERDRLPLPAARRDRIPKPEWFGRGEGRQSRYAARHRQTESTASRR